MIGPLLIVVAVTAGGPVEDPAKGVVDRSSDRTAYEAARKEAGQDAQAHVRLALWCERHGMTTERIKHLAAAVLYAPSNALARGLMGLVNHDGKWERPDDVSREIQDDPKRQALMREYLARRAKAPDRADDQWRLATWCDRSGLKEQAVAHAHAVLRLDPKREAAWRYLGFKKAGGRWVKPEWQAAYKAEADEQNRANKHWKPLLEQWRAGLSSRDKNRRAGAEAGLADLTDPRAVPMIWAVFAARGAEGQKAAVRLLAQIDAPGSSRALTLLALRSPVAEVRRDAIQILRMRDPRDFAPLLIGWLRDTIKYEVRRVNGPGSPGELLIKNKDVNIDRLYSPPPMPYIAFQPGDSLGYDATGLPAINRFLGTSPVPLPMSGDNVSAAKAAVAQAAALLEPHSSFSNMGLPANVAATLNTYQAQATRLPVDIRIPSDGLHRQEMMTASVLVNQTERIPIGQMMLESQKAAQYAEQQLEGDVAAIRTWNASVQESNQGVLQVLSRATGIDLGADRTAWEKWVVDLFGYAYSSPSSASSETPTIVEQVPLAYQPQPVPVVVVPQVAGFQIAAHSCFGAGTSVRTLDGLLPIEKVRVGDLVLTQHPKSGELKYWAVITVYHNPPNATFRVALDGGESIVATGIHRLWKAGKGWTMARELKPGDVLRTLGGLATVKSVDADRTQPVYNLEVADGESYFVGRSGVLAHDNSTINAVPEPFDAVATLAEAATSARARPRSMLGR